VTPAPSEDTGLDATLVEVMATTVRASARPESDASSDITR